MLTESKDVTSAQPVRLPFVPPTPKLVLYLLKKVLRPLVLANVLMVLGCRARTIVVTQEVTREVTVVVSQSSPEAPQATAKPEKTEVQPEEDHHPSPELTEAPPVMVAGALAPYPSAPLCLDSGPAHDNDLFHTLWDDERGCHYDHEHGESPFTAEVKTSFPGFDLPALLGGVQIGHTNPSSPMENTHKHGGFKWQVLLSHPQGCAGFEGSDIGVDASVIQYHAFGDYSVEFESRVHSAMALLRQCRAQEPTEYGYVYVVQHVDYGQRVVPYQGQVMPYPDTPDPGYDSGLGPYFTLDCVGNVSHCRPSREFVLDRNVGANSVWTSEPRQISGSGSSLFELLFRVRDNYQLLDWSDQSYPFTFVWLCSADEGLTFRAIVGCGYNNSTTRVQEINGTIPAEWDNMQGFDTDTRRGRITAQGYVTRFGALNSACTGPGEDCHSIRMEQAFVGYYGSLLIDDKEIQHIPAGQPERDIYFCGDDVCAEGDLAAVSSGWIGPTN
jgi:hypothetical protein